MTSLLLCAILCSILLLLLLFVITFMQGIYSYISETNHASRTHNVAAILWLQFMLHGNVISHV